LLRNPSPAAAAAAGSPCAAPPAADDDGAATAPLVAAAAAGLTLVARGGRGAAALLPPAPAAPSGATAWLLLMPASGMATDNVTLRLPLLLLLWRRLLLLLLPPAPPAAAAGAAMLLPWVSPAPPALVLLVRLLLLLGRGLPAAAPLAPGPRTRYTFLQDRCCRLGGRPASCSCTLPMPLCLTVRACSRPHAARHVPKSSALTWSDTSSDRMRSWCARVTRDQGAAPGTAARQGCCCLAPSWALLLVVPVSGVPHRVLGPAAVTAVLGKADGLLLGASFPRSPSGAKAAGGGPTAPAPAPAGVAALRGGKSS
jgi:hypothetical protein